MGWYVVEVGSVVVDTCGSPTPTPATAATASTNGPSIYMAIVGDGGSGNDFLAELPERQHTIRWDQPESNDTCRNREK